MPEEVPSSVTLFSLECLVAIAGGMVTNFTELSDAGQWTAMAATILAIGLIDGSSAEALARRRMATALAAFILALTGTWHMRPNTPSGIPWPLAFLAYAIVLSMVSASARPILAGARVVFMSGPDPILKLNKIIRAVALTAAGLGLLWAAVKKWWP